MSDILLDRDGPVAVVTLNRPDRLNAVTLPMLVDLTRILGDLDGDDTVGAVVLTGAGRGFCAGGDVKGMVDGSPRSFEGRVADLRQRHRAPLLLRTMSKLVIAAVNGPAMGAGLGLALACDLRMASPSARFATAFAKVDCRVISAGLRPCSDLSVPPRPASSTMLRRRPMLGKR